MFKCDWESIRNERGFFKSWSFALGELSMKQPLLDLIRVKWDLFQNEVRLRVTLVNLLRDSWESRCRWKRTSSFANPFLVPRDDKSTSVQREGFEWISFLHLLDTALDLAIEEGGRKKMRPQKASDGRAWRGSNRASWRSILPPRAERFEEGWLMLPVEGDEERARDL